MQRFTMIRRWLLFLLGSFMMAAGACGVNPPATPQPDAGTTQTPDAGETTPADAGIQDAGLVEVPDAGAPVSYSQEIQPIFDAHCSGCHSYGGTVRPFLTSEATAARAQLPGSTSRNCVAGGRAPYLVPGKPEESHLYYRLTGTSALPQAAECGRMMPADMQGGGTPLIATHPEKVERVRRWILQGAKFD
jgi:hypothetical protein